MQTKLFTILDNRTNIPAMAVRTEEESTFRTAGFHSYPYIIMTSLNPLRTEYYPNGWPNSTLAKAHCILQKIWYDFPDSEFELDVRRYPDELEDFTY